MSDRLSQRLAALEKAVKNKPKKASAEIVQLPLWVEPARGVPNSALRGALFAAIQGKYRQAFKGLGAGVFEIVLRHRTDAYRTVYTVQLDEDIWVIHAFQKKSKTGIKTPKPDVDLVRERLKRLKEQLR